MEFRDVLSSPTYLVTGLAISLAGYWWISRRNSKMPPGPTPLPILGNILELWKYPLTYKHFVELSKKYGDVITIQIASIQTVVLNSITVVREALVHKQNDFAGRPKTYSGDLFTSNGKDIAFGQFTPVWKLQRKLAHEAIRQFMTGTNLEIRITESVDNVTEAFKQQKEPFDPLKHLSLLIYNIIANVTFGKQWKFEDPEFQELVKVVQDFTEIFGNGLPADFLPVLKYLPKTSREKQAVELLDWFINYFRKIYQEHKDAYKPGEESDLMYHLIGMMKKAEAEGDASLSEITDEHMFQIVSDFFGAGTDTSRFTLQWCLCYLTAYPEIQEKVFKEIDDLCGSYPVTLEHRHHLNYTDAFLHEVLRMQPIAPLAVPHTTTCDTSVGGYELPKGTWVMVNLWALHHDPKEWDDPEAFKPERFLDEDGKMAPKPNSYLPFSSGRRVCVGEALAKSELLLSLSLLCQRFKFEAPPGEKVVPEAVFSALACMSKGYKIIATPRQA